MRTERAIPNDTRFVNEARRFVTDAIGAVPHPFLFDVQLMTSELVNNALLHAGSSCVVSVDTHDQMITVAVTDMGGGQPSVRDADHGQMSGRGLMIVAALARQWGITDAVPPPGKTVWFTVERPATPPTSRARRADLPTARPATADVVGPEVASIEPGPSAPADPGYGSRTDARADAGHRRSLVTIG